jgi:uncharacterized protein GlcG (DUF336 family)
MTSHKLFLRVGRIFLLAAIVTLASGGAWAQGDRPLPLDRAVMSGDMAQRAVTKGQISADIAQQIVEACVDLAKAANGSVSVFVLAPDGQIVHSHRMDGQNTVNTDTAYRKAQTALIRRESTRASANQFATLDSKIARVNLNYYLVPGGLPIVVEDTVIGSIGVGGGFRINDEQCAYQALTKVLGPQPPLAPTMPPNPLGAGRGRGGAAPQGQAAPGGGARGGAGQQ